MTTLPASRPRRRSFAATVVAGLASAALTAVAANQTWATAKAEEGRFAFSTLTEAPQVPLVLTLALVVLAAWGVVLVTRGVVRRVVAALGALAAVGALVATMAGRWTLEDSFERDFADQGATAVVSFGGWWWVAVVAGVLAAVTAVLAAVNVGRWPEMGTRYDA
ncbi:MAG: Trp biosynthesis-associated membrane protein, partial [Actinomycetota bacterium]|nr:Trp biosynthesis-associated membrane protein [Actinomycetota bacterium]